VAAQRAADLAWPGRPQTWRELPARLRGTASELLRLTTAAVLAWLIAARLTGTVYDLTSALTALLVLRASAYSTVRMGLLRVGAVLTGVLVAVAFSSLAGLTWWSLAAVIAASLVLAKVFRLGAQALEVPISAMLILGVSSPDLVAEARVVHTLVGAGVGVLFNLMLPAAVPTRRASSQVLRVAYAAAECLDGASRALVAGRVRRSDLQEWGDQARAVSGLVARASAAVHQVEEAQRRGTGPSSTSSPPARSAADGRVSSRNRATLPRSRQCRRLNARIPDRGARANKATTMAPAGERRRLRRSPASAKPAHRAIPTMRRVSPASRPQARAS
jgi:hypothetical protein